jgi:hypothetical protein
VRRAAAVAVFWATNVAIMAVAVAVCCSLVREAAEVGVGDPVVGVAVAAGVLVGVDVVARVTVAVNVGVVVRVLVAVRVAVEVDVGVPESAMMTSLCRGRTNENTDSATAPAVAAVRSLGPAMRVSVAQLSLPGRVPTRADSPTAEHVHQQRLG